MFKWYMVGCANMNKHQNNKKIGLCTQNMLTILDSIVNTIGEDPTVYDHSMNTTIFTLLMNK